MTSRVLAILLLLTLPLATRASADARLPTAGSEGASSEPSKAQARVAFQRGVQASSKRDYVAAEKLFREALALHYAPATAFNLASALYELDRFVEAYNLVQDVLAADGTPDAVRSRATELSATLELEVARLNVVVSGTTNGLSAEVDGAPLSADKLGKPLAVSAGKHEVAALRDGSVISRREVDIPLRTTALVDLSLIVTESPPVVVAAAPAPAAAPVRDDRGTWYRRNRKVFWISVAAGVAVVGGGAAAAILLSGKEARTAEPVRGDTGVISW